MPYKAKGDQGYGGDGQDACKGVPTCFLLVLTKSSIPTPESHAMVVKAFELCVAETYCRNIVLQATVACSCSAIQGGMRSTTLGLWGMSL